MKLQSQQEFLKEQYLYYIYFVLYIIYVSSLGHLDIFGKLFSYADDTAILISGDNWDEVHLKAETNLYLINTWLLKHNLRINYTKSNYINFTLDKRNQPNSNTIKIHDNDCKFNNCSYNVINKTETIKYLGISYDQHLKWDTHTNNIILKLRKMHYLFINARKFLN